ncbi:uncharacterized protein BX664DRAFT_293163 [Halteromyces radiatus]|uniref:uncharacterized protein n=1 Tax=Halteromyces radiatus TaxID=101107 RepID=UPI00221F7766|nr:uncharacterized protein BX664DRAFT_293163 [Halteromyces radiatus]KAI8097560.1 hypothetical protein BX664DRAFT_293163 [Halteromyces radiatus]
MTTLVSLVGRTLPRTTRWIHTTSYVLTAKPTTEPPSTTTSTTTTTTATTTDDLTTKNKHLSSKPSTLTKGRKQTRKTKRQLPLIPDSFLLNNYIAHTTIPLEPIDPIYHFPEHLWQELRLSLLAGLAPKGTLASFDHSDHIILNVPKQGATYLQDNLARQLANVTNSDLVIFDPQDLLSLAQENSGNVMTLLPTLSKGNSDISTILAIQPDVMNSSASIKEQYDIDQESASGTSNNINNNQNQNETDVWTMDIDDTTSITSISQLLKNKDKLVSKAMNGIVGRYSTMFKNILQIQKTKSTNSTPLAGNRKIIYLRDYGEMHDVFGSLMLKSLMMAVEDLRRTGQQLVVFGGHSPSLQQQSQQQHSSSHSETMTTMSHDMDDMANGDHSDGAIGSYKYSLQSDSIPLLNGMKCIHVMPPISPENIVIDEWEAQLAKDAAQRIGELNARQLLVVHQHKRVLGIKSCHQDASHQKYNNMVQQLCEQVKNIKDELWTADQVDRRVTVALGHALQANKDYVDIHDFVKANDIIGKGTSIYRQATQLLESHRTLALGKDGMVDIESLRRGCNTHESCLISRIVDPGKVQSTFKDVQAPQTTIETLQTLISLPLQRPDLFQYGILKKNFISGVLLFGPPGTGKTMLAKAVAKESGSRMLEIQASDVYEMYVGEGEKNVKAIFSLARKLSPCVIFIDEVDSLMNRRQSEATSNAHREIINQFMVEWDGLSSDNQGVMVMAATNRPFDLDDAVLRRMPRRVLVDLPKKEDRTEILKKLLKDEDYNISVEKLAQATPHYSGSDLKNLCVTAALKSIQQGNKDQKRRLEQIHFDEALKMVPASSSEDMDSLVEIRKWALKYGDGYQKKPKSSFGF